MVRDFNIAKREEDVSFYAGFEGSAFMVGRTLTAMLWGVVADRYGRKPVMILSTLSVNLSYNKFSGDLPTSFISLKSLTKLFLENNVLSGSVVYLGDLNLTDLDIRDNHFSGIIP